MERNITYLLLVLSIMFIVMCGCTANSKDNYQEDLSHVELADVTSIKLEPEKIEVTDDDIDKAVEAFIYMNEVLINKDGVIEAGDVVDLILTTDGQEKEYTNITVGDEEVDEEIDLELIGLPLGSSKTFVTNGKEYTVTVNKIKFYPSELTDSIVKDFSDYETVDEFKVYVKETIRSNRIQEEAYYELVYHSVITKEPSGLHEYVEKMMDNYESESSGDEYKKDLEDFYYEMLILNAFAKQINVYPSEEQLKELISDMAMDEECASEDIIEKYGVEYLTYIYNYDRVCAYLLENVLVDN